MNVNVKLPRNHARLRYREFSKGRWMAGFYFNGFQNVQLGFHVNLRIPNFEIHVPFGFCRIGMKDDLVDASPVTWSLEETKQLAATANTLMIATAKRLEVLQREASSSQWASEQEAAK
jgi:hypothetical protein